MILAWIRDIFHIIQRIYDFLNQYPDAFYFVYGHVMDELPDREVPYRR